MNLPNEYYYFQFTSTVNIFDEKSAIQELCSGEENDIKRIYLEGGNISVSTEIKQLADIIRDRLSELGIYFTFQSIGEIKKEINARVTEAERKKKSCNNKAQKSKQRAGTLCSNSKANKNASALLDSKPWRKRSANIEASQLSFELEHQYRLEDSR